MLCSRGVPEVAHVCEFLSQLAKEIVFSPKRMLYFMGLKHTEYSCKGTQEWRIFLAPILNFVLFHFFVSYA
jgi:hypothetical protein